MSTAQGSLSGLRVLVTRPAHQADPLCRLIEARGGSAVRLPLLSIVPTAHPVAVTQTLREAADCDGWIFTSANAVHHARELWQAPWPASLAAVGPATAAALGEDAQAVVAPLAAYSGEALLALPQFHNISGRRFLIVTGEDGLGQIEPCLRERGATVRLAEVYRRVPLPYPEDRVVAALRGVGVIVVTSGAALAHLLRLTPDSARAGLLKKQLVAPSARVVENAQALGFRSVQAPPRMSDAALIELIERTRPAAQD